MADAKISYFIGLIKVLQNDRFNHETDYNDWEHGFIDSMQALVSKYGEKMLLSPKQKAKIVTLVEKHVPEELYGEEDEIEDEECNE